MYSDTRVPFFMPYGSAEETNKRLSGTVILRYGEPVLVLKVLWDARRKKINVYGTLNDGSETTFEYIPDNGIDLAPPPAQYHDLGGKYPHGVWVFFPPTKGVYQQGRRSANSLFIVLGGNWKENLPIKHIQSVMKGPIETRSLFEEKTLVNVKNGKNALLSPHVAIYSSITAAGEVVQKVAYRGNDVGVLKHLDEINNIGYFTPDLPSLKDNIWCLRRLGEVGLTIGE